jgi:hypothetical protein
MTQYERIQGRDSHPTPRLLVNIYNPIDSELFKENVKMIVDTGSDITFVPEEVFAELGNLPRRARPWRITNPNRPGAFQTTYPFLISLKWDDGIEQRQHEVEVLSLPKTYGILGRDILNQYKIILDSPQEEWAFKCRWDNGIKCDDKSCILKVTTSNLIV